jgi:hypothetical protein
MFIAALFTIAKVLEQPRCPSTDEWIKKMWCLMHNGILFSHKEECNFVIHKYMDGTGEHHLKQN